MKKTVLSACPLDCFDLCSFRVHLDGERIVGIDGNREHPVTRGFVCSRAQRLIDRLYSPDRITCPLIREGTGWRKASWDEALDLIAGKLLGAVERYGPRSILHISSLGSTGVLKRLDRRFFNALGGVTTPSGSLCWSAGTAAQQADFGGYVAPAWSDVVRSRTIILWGRDPATTNVHLIPYIQEAKEKGAKVIVINPLRVPSVQFADQHLAVKPGADGLLALSMAYVILEERLWHSDYVHRHVAGFESYARAVTEFAPEKVCRDIGIEAKDIRDLARLYTHGRPSTIILGYGLQRYVHGGNTIRAIDALSAITGQLGIPGGGIHYGNQRCGTFGREIEGRELANESRQIPWPYLAEEISRLNSQNQGEPPIGVLVVNRANPLSQMPDLSRAWEAFHSIPFKAAIDFFLTDTARLADVVLPAASSFEEEDVLATAWNDYIHYQPAVVKPRGQVWPEYRIWQELAARIKTLNRDGKSVPWKDSVLWNRSSSQWLSDILMAYGMKLEDLQAGPRPNPGVQVVPFKDGVFKTPSGKMELLRDHDVRALVRAVRAMAVQDGRFTLISIHQKGRLNSQFWDIDAQDSPDITGLNDLRLHPDDARDLVLRPGDAVLVETEQGSHRFIARVDTGVTRGVAVVAQGVQQKDGGGVNKLTAARSTDLGHGVAYNQTFCQIRKLPMAESISIQKET